MPVRPCLAGRQAGARQEPDRKTMSGEILHTVSWEPDIFNNALCHKKSAGATRSTTPTLFILNSILAEL